VRVAGEWGGAELLVRLIKMTGEEGGTFNGLERKGVEGLNKGTAWEGNEKRFETMGDPGRVWNDGGELRGDLQQKREECLKKKL